MRDEELRTELARLRRRVRQLESEIEFLRNESRRFRHVGFGPDIKESQLMALEEEYDSYLSRIAAIQRRLGQSQTKRRHSLDWLAIPIALIMLGSQAIFQGKWLSALRNRQRRAPVDVRPVAAVDLSMTD